MADQMIRKSDDQKMKNLLRLEELAQFLFCLALLWVIDAAWWAYLLLLLGPDIGMLGYLVNTRVGAFAYNLLHHKGIPVLVLFLVSGVMYERFLMWSKGMVEFDVPWPVMAAIILYGHASMDRIFGYGLKFGDSFHHTHLGWIGKNGRE